MHKTFILLFDCHGDHVKHAACWDWDHLTQWNFPSKCNSAKLCIIYITLVVRAVTFLLTTCIKAVIWMLRCHWLHTEHQKHYHDDVIKLKHFPRYWPFVWGIHRSPVNSPHKGRWRGALMHSLICAWINGWVNSREDGDLRRHHAHYDVTVTEYFTHI